MTAESKTSRQEPRKEMQEKLLEINTWAMLLIIALTLQRASDVAIFIVGTPLNVDAKVWAAFSIMALTLGLLLATTVGILALHVHFEAPYRYWHVMLDNIFIMVPMYVAVRFIAASITKAPAAAVRLDETMFRVGAILIAFSFIFLFTRDFLVLPKINSKLSVPPLVAVSMLHLLGALLFISLAIFPDAVLYAAVIATIGLSFFFAGMAAIPFIEKHFAAARPNEPSAPGPNSPSAPAQPPQPTAATG
jgi:hypothetical protein